ncbi:uncharacterized protein ASPGLDRAFT_213946 [Aspergillus glaucus CBS 516.65]|uniref:Major facilitator superfamily (MFS) profile domain-containing protein n=1 Tax=Aspergillus glaucus CBS 516.65 TaxID=1160497 RepID=A0A1L9VZ77_ASPGL|nr:hypothetical protein ASPGLDRAFT_213946 [Aspergillus glaucus CBS 516.65]OJJ89218.1 hypothetical protein ASPGLDRAFT_213946 [Aspergillus glaucus CBS 516.65]
MVQLILSRVLAGISGAGIISLVSVIVTDIVPPKEVALFRSYAKITNITGRSLGAPIGGGLSQTVGWRWSFYGQLHILIISVIITACNMPSTLNQTPQESTKIQDQENRFPRHPQLHGYNPPTLISPSEYGFQHYRAVFTFSTF